MPALCIHIAKQIHKVLLLPLGVLSLCRYSCKNLPLLLVRLCAPPGQLLRHLFLFYRTVIERQL